MVVTGGLRRLLALFGGLVAALCLPLALSGPTSWLLLPAHLGLAVLASVGASAEGWAGRGERARLWGLFFLVATACIVAALEAAARSRGSGAWYWGPAWVGLLAWGWIPPVIAGIAGVVGDARRTRSSARVVRKRRVALRRARDGQPA